MMDEPGNRMLRGPSHADTGKSSVPEFAKRSTVTNARRKGFAVD